MDAPIDVRIDGSIAWVTLNNPDRRNALSLPVLKALHGELSLLGADPGIGAIVLSGEGPAFSSGHDLAEMRNRDLEFHETLFAACVEVMTLLHQLPQPVIAAVDGIATAAGCQLVASCDLVIASSEARFATPGVRIGLFCSTPMVALTRAIGQKRALQMLLTGEPIDAVTAAEWGLVNQVVEPGDLANAAAALADRITEASAHTLALGKRAFYEQIELAESAAYELTHKVMSINAADDVAAEGIGAFLDKRPPRWPM